VRKSRPARTPIHINEAVREVAALLEPETREAGVHLRLDLDEALPLTPADFVQIQQVLLNLMRNSLDAMADTDPPGRELTVATGPACDGQVEISVRDRGRGVAAENVARLFEPFFTTKAGGLGLGLPISRTIVEAHGGRLWLTPNVDGGMNARFILPTIEPRGQYVAGTDGIHRR
jgi:two-component system sensor histidine kinase TtrS